MFFSPLPSSATRPPSAEQVADRLQQLYDETSTFVADFQQITTMQLRRARKKEASGTVIIKKPGFMRWDYRRPDVQVLLCDGQTLSLYTKKTGQMVTGSARQYLESDITYAFFTGKGSIIKDFKVLPPEDGPVTGDNLYRIRLIPKQPHPHVDVITVAVDKDSFVIRAMEILDRFGGRTVFLFNNIKRNIPIDDGRFQFTPPPGTEIITQQP